MNITITEDSGDKVGVTLLSKVVSTAQLYASTNSSVAADANAFGVGVSGSNVIDSDADVRNMLLLGVPFLILWFLGLILLFYATDEDGMLKGKRKVESDPQHRIFRILSTVAVYLVEGVQLAAVAFGPASTKALRGGDTSLKVLGVWIFHGHIFNVAFPVIAVIQLLMVLLLFVPALLWRKLERVYYKPVHASYVHKTPLCHAIAFINNCYLFYLTIPFAIVLLSPIPCDFYHDEGTRAVMSADSGVACGGSEYLAWSIVGGAIVVLSYCMGVMSGAVPILVERHTDLALNGRFVSLRFAIKVALAVTYVLFAERHAYAHLVLTFVLQWALVVSHVTILPSLVERLNFHRSAAYIFPTIITVCLIVSVALDDEESPFVFIAALVAMLVTAALLLVKYYCLPSRHRFPPIKVVEENVGEVRRYVAWHNLQNVRDAHVAEYSRRKRMAHGGDRDDGEDFGDEDAHDTDDTPDDKLSETQKMIGADASGEAKLLGGGGVSKTQLDDDDDYDEGDTLNQTRRRASKVDTEHIGGNNGDDDDDKDVAGLLQHRRSSVSLLENTQTYSDSRHLVGSLNVDSESKNEKDDTNGSSSVQQSCVTMAADADAASDVEAMAPMPAQYSYEGAWVLGLHLPHGNGTTQSLDTDDVFTGQFVFGLKHGYGVHTHFTTAKQGDEIQAIAGDSLLHRQQGKNQSMSIADMSRIHKQTFDENKIVSFFYQGHYTKGKRGGFGTSNILDHRDATLYEGQWKDDHHHGKGYMTFPDGDVIAGDFHRGAPHGSVRWTYTPGHAATQYTIEGDFVKGKLSNSNAGTLLPEVFEYTGEKRFGVPHGRGDMRIPEADVTLGGEWRAGKLHGYGVMQRGEVGGQGSSKYKGFFVEGLFHGMGTWADGEETYHGMWQHGRKHGNGCQDIVEGTYEGLFADGRRQGYGTFRYTDGSVYQGGWDDNCYHGAGLLRSPDGVEYEGNWIRGQRHGTRGIMSFADGTSYVGGWYEDDFHDQGTLIVKDLGTYTGTFEVGARHGLGRFVFEDGSEHVGLWSGGLANGEGHITFLSRKALALMTSMDLYDQPAANADGGELHSDCNFLSFGGDYGGHFLSGYFSGQGKLIAGDGTTYTGSWQRGLPHGEGTIEFPEGSVYTGSFTKGVRHGQGVMQYPDNRVYRGGWVDGQRHGHGIMFGRNKEVLHDCQWIHGMVQTAVGGAEDGGGVEEDLHGASLEEPPVVDMTGLLRAILPPKSEGALKVEEKLLRRGIQREELQARIRIQICVEEELLWQRLTQFFSKWIEKQKKKEIAESQLMTDEKVAELL